MIKAGLAGLVVAFIYITSITLVSPFCTLCITPLLGLGVGYLANRFDQPLKFEASLGSGAIAGAMAGFGALLGQIVATLINGILVTNSQELRTFFNSLGLSPFPESGEYWQATLTANSFCGLFNLAVVAGLGAVGGLIWFQRQAAKKTLSTLLA